MAFPTIAFPPELLAERNTTNSSNNYNSSREDENEDFLNVSTMEASCFGICMAFPTIAFPPEMLVERNATNSSDGYSFSHEDFLNVGTIEASWIASLLLLTSVVSSILSGFFTDRCGRKFSTLLCAVLFLISWIVLIIGGSNIQALYASRSLAGIAEGLGVSGTIYTTEATHVSVRTMLLAMCSVLISMGIILASVIGYLFTWIGVAYFSAGLAILTCLALLYIPESPVWLATVSRKTKNSDTKLIQSLQWLYRNKQQYEEELERIRKTSQKEPIATEENAQNTENSKLWKPVLLLCILFLLQQLSGGFIIIFFALQIFQAAGSVTTNAWTSLIGLGIIRLVMSIFSSFRYFGRRTLLISSSLGMAASVLFAALWLTFSTPSLIVVLCVLLYVTFSSFGLLGLPWTLVGELLPATYRGKFSGYSYAFVFIIMFITVLVFLPLVEIIGLAGIFYGFGVFSLIFAGFVYYYIPETSGKSIEEIQKEF